MVSPQSQASEAVLRIYTDIKSTFGITYVPMMFRYLAHYPSYMERLWDTIKLNVSDPVFIQTTTSIKHELIQTSDAIIQASPSITKVALRLIEPHNRDKVASEIEMYFDTQVKLAYISIAIRERTKGWAIGAKYLTDENNQRTSANSGKANDVHLQLHDIVIAETATALSQRDDIREPLMKYIVYIHEEFTSIITQEQYLFTRVDAEKILIRSVQHMPHPLFASYNEVAKSVEDKRQLGDLFFLLSEKFPVGHTVSSLMWALSIRMLSQG